MITIERSMRAGIFPPLVTPLQADKRIDVEGFEKLITHVLEGGADGLFVLGTTVSEHLVEIKALIESEAFV